MSIHCVFPLYSIDPSLGKVDKYSLSQETLLELLTQGITKKKKAICAPLKNSETLIWKNIRCNDDDEITEIDWYNKGLVGSIELKWLPLASKAVYLSSNRLSGTADLTCLPVELVNLDLGSNCFEGTLDLTRLPSKMEELWLYENEFTGVTDFSLLPKSLMYLDMSDTHLEGEVLGFEGNFETGFVKNAPG